MERLARQSSRREDKERAEDEMQRLAPERQRVEAEKLARDHAREGKGQPTRAGDEQAVLDAEKSAGLDHGELGRVECVETTSPRGESQRKGDRARNEGEVDSDGGREGEGLLGMPLGRGEDDGREGGRGV